MAQWIEEIEEPVLDHDEELGKMIQDLTRKRQEPVKDVERLHEINLTNQRRCGVDPEEMQDEVDDDEDTSLSSSSSSLDMPHDSDVDGGDDGDDSGGYGEVPPHMMETVEHFPFDGYIHPSRGYQRIVPPTKSSQAGASGSGYDKGAGTSASDVKHQQAMYGAYGEYGQQPYWPTQSAQKLRGLHEYGYNPNDPPRCLPHEFYHQEYP